MHVGLVCLPVLTWGTTAQKSRYLHDLVSANRIGAFGLTEPNVGSDIVGMRSTADKDGDGYRLNGEKMWISLADVADTFLVFARTDREKMRARDHSGMSAFGLEWGMPGLSTDAVQVHGAYRFSGEYPVERFYRSAKGSSIYEGSREIQKLMQADYGLGLRRDEPGRCVLPVPESLPVR